MIIWRGWGILTVVIAGITVGAAAILDVKYNLLGPWVMVALALAGGLANWFIGRSLNRPLELVGIGYWKRHWLLFIQMEWWSALFFLLSAYIAFLALVHP